jgi:succinate dehydrogenase / fumarate reductase cytochrome b subunit
MNAFAASILSFSKSSIGRKTIVAITGAAMVLFLIGHLLGNLLIFKGSQAMNEYAKMLHDNKALLLGARVGILVCFVAHVYFTIVLTKENKAARPVAYGYQKTRQASMASRTMFWSGLIVLSFVLYHLAHFTWGIGNEYYTGLPRYQWQGTHHVYNMVVDGFHVPIVSFFYLLSLGLLCWHLSHGVASMFQTLGLTTPKTRGIINLGSRAFSAALFLGFASIPLAVLFGLVK